MMRKCVLASRFENNHYNPSKSLISLITSTFTFSQNRACSSTQQPNVKSYVLFDYLIGSLKLSKARALSVSKSFSHIKSIENPENVVRFFKASGFSDAQIQSLAHGLPTVLFASVEKTLKPKVVFLQELGLSGPCLGAFVIKNLDMLRCSLDRSLKPSVFLIKKVLRNDGRIRSDEEVTDDMLRVFTRYNRLVHVKSRLKENIEYLERCGIVGSQLSGLLSRQPRLFGMRKEKLAELVSRAVDMDFAVGSGMLAHAIHCLSCLSIKTLNGRFEVFRKYGFSKDEVALMFRRSPFVVRLAEAKLRWKIDFFLNNLEIDKMDLVKYPGFLTFSVEERIIPRRKVLEILKSKNLFKKDLSLHKVIYLSDERFLEKFVLPFKDDAEELLLAYNDKIPRTSERLNKSENDMSKLKSWD